MIGYSFGELTVAAVSGVFTLSDAIKLISLRGQAMHEAPSGIMLSVPMPEEELKAILLIAFHWLLLMTLLALCRGLSLTFPHLKNS